MQFLDQIIFTFARVYYKQQQQKTSFCIYQHFEKLPKFCVITSVYEFIFSLKCLVGINKFNYLHRKSSNFILFESHNCVSRKIKIGRHVS